jgi:hypothetical protein
MPECGLDFAGGAEDTALTGGGCGDEVLAL